MPPPLALLLWSIFLVWLLRFDLKLSRSDSARAGKTSLILWVPVIWISIVGSRLPSQWLGMATGQAAQTLEEGNPLDSVIYSVLILLGVGILISRRFKWGDVANRNLALTVYLFFALTSVLWSDYSFIAAKRWVRDLGSYLMIFIVLSDPTPLEAVRTLLRRLCFLLIPLSIMLLKYYPGISIGYDRWTGLPEHMGVTTSKNMLGVLCLVSGIFLFWDTVMRWSKRKERWTKKVILVNVAFIAMTLWLLDMSNSATSRLCLVLGCLVIAVAHSKTIKRRPVFLEVAIPVVVCLYLVLAFGFGVDINAELAMAVGRDPSLTGRTNIWSAVLSTHTNPLIGTGYESFWLGPRLRQVWALAGAVNEAHNGYLEVYLNLGLIGLFLLAVFLISSYRTVCKTYAKLPSLGSFALALWAILPFYNVTESAFRIQLMFVMFLLGAIAVPQALSVPGVAPLADLHLKGGEAPHSSCEKVTV